MQTKQIYNILKVSLFCLLFIFAFELIFSFEAVNLWVGNLIESSTSKFTALLIVWIILFLQVWLIPVPAYIVILAASHTNLVSSGFFNIATNDIIFFIVTLSAYICGFCLAYFIGRKWGIKAVEWAAGSKDTYEKWSKTLTTKGKWWYALTVLFPFFPDDILCLVAGSVKLNFTFFFLVNTICRSIGLLFMLELIKFMETWNSGGFPISLIVWGILLLANIIALIVMKIKNKKSNLKE